MHTNGNAYMKTAGKSDKCDAYVETDDPNVQSVLFTVQSLSEKNVLSIGTNTTTVALDLENGAASVGDGTDGFTMYAEPGITFGITISAGTAIFTKDGVSFHEQPDLPEDFVSGFGKLQMCGNPGTTAFVDFTLTE
eukprot:2128857-Amphidinium_carterae.1